MREDRKDGENRLERPERPWLRSRLFWIGLVPLVFLMWAWWQSMRRYDFIDLRVGGFGTAFITSDGGFQLVHWQADPSPMLSDAPDDPFAPAGEPEEPEFFFFAHSGFAHPGDFSRRWFPSGPLASQRDDGGDPLPGETARGPEAVFHPYPWPFLPYWLITLVYLLLWTGAMGIRRRLSRPRTPGE